MHTLKLPSLDPNQRLPALFAAGVAAILVGVACFDWRGGLILAGACAVAVAFLCYEKPEA